MPPPPRRSRRARAAPCRPPGSRPRGRAASRRRAGRPSAMTSSGCFCMHTDIASGQRGWKRQPGRRVDQVRRRAGDVVEAGRAQRDRRPQQLARVGVGRLGEDLARVALLGDPAGVHHRDPVAGLGDDAEVVGDQQQRRCRSSRAGRRGCRGSAPRRSRRAPSSARRRSAGSGSSTSASAIMIRWRIPPENSCGYCLKRVGGIPIFARVSSAALRISSLSMSGRCVRRVSRKWLSIVCSGSSRVIGSWKISPRSGPRRSRSSSVSRAAMLRPA